MKKILLSIFSILLGFVGFSSADFFSFNIPDYSFRYGSPYTFSLCNSWDYDIIVTWLTFKALYWSEVSLSSSPLLICADSSCNDFSSVSFPESFYNSPDNFVNTLSVNIFISGNSCVYLSKEPVGLYSFSSSDSISFIDSDFFVSFFYDDYFGLYFSFIDWLYYYYQFNDIFTVNYWSTSKEYTLTEDIDIFINSPVIKDWNTFIFDWSTWINLFYNNISDWYNKNKLYLWWNYNYTKWVFNPVCM